jgi:hypothetical protein
MENIVITEQGKQLMSKVISETESMTFTKIAVSDYDYSGVELQNISELQSVKQTAIISKTSRTDGKTVEILAAINNEQIPESYYVRTLGVYVKDSSENEILYGISISGENPDYMPAYEGKTLSGVSYRINVAVEDSEYITVNVNPAAVPTIMQVEDIDTAFREHTEDKVSHITAVERKKWDAVTEKVNKEEGKGLSHNDFTDADKKKLDGIAAGANKTIVDNELNSYSSNPVQNQVVYEEMLKRMAQKWVGSHLYTLYGIVVPSTVNGANTGSHYLDVKTGNTYIMTRYTDRGAQAWTNTGTLQSVEEILNSKFDKSNIANNLVTTEEGYVADARQLNESIKGSFAEKIINKLSYISSRIKSSTIYEKSTKTISSTEEVAYAFNNPGIYYFNCHCIAYGTSSACLLLVSGSGSVEEAGIIILGKIEKTITFAVESSFLANGTQVVYVPRLKLNIPSGARGEYTKSLYQII